MSIFLEGQQKKANPQSLLYQVTKCLTKCQMDKIEDALIHIHQNLIGFFVCICLAMFIQDLAENRIMACSKSSGS